MEYVIALVCGLAPLVLGFVLNKFYGERRHRRVRALPSSTKTNQFKTNLLAPSLPVNSGAIEPGLLTTAKVSPPVSDAPPTVHPFTAVGPTHFAPAATPRFTSTDPRTIQPPLQTREAVLKEEPAAKRRPAKVHVVLDPEHFKRHSDVPGYLYLARNDERREHLYKIGYTTETPDKRIAALNSQLDDATDIGTFRLLHSVPVSSSYDMEQALFAALAERRVIGEREFFYAPEEVLVRAMNALVRMPTDGGETINDFLASDAWVDCERLPPAVLPEWPVPKKSNPGGGWVYVFQNFWHKPGTSYYVVSEQEPDAIVTRLNSAQRRLTSQLGFYRIVACKVVMSTETARAHAAVLFGPYRIHRRKPFVRASLDVVRSIVDRIDGGVAPPTQSDQSHPRAASKSRPPPVQPALQRMASPAELDPCTGAEPSCQRALISVDVVVEGFAPKQWVAWTAHCERCRTLLRYRGAILDRGVARCPRCAHTVVAMIAARGVFLEPL